MCILKRDSKVKRMEFQTHKLVVSKEHRLGSIYYRFSEHVTYYRHVAPYL